MILTTLPVLPPDLRPMVQLDGGKFAISGINDLYRRVINRNNRLRHLMEIGAPEIIVRNEKRMLQDAVDSLIDNSRRGQTTPAAGNHKLKSLSDMLRGKQGRFRQNLLGKRVDYSGRSVIVVGPQLQLHQCGLPKRMALELFKPFVMRRLMQLGLAHNIRSARRLVERAKPEVYDMLEEVVKERPVLLNRAPTLHRLSIQAFEPILIDGSAIQLHPLVCTAFNADFDGDQMAVHVPLSKAAVKEAREEMLSIRNILVPSSGEPIVTPTLDMVLGCYYMTTLKPGAKGEGKVFAGFEDAKFIYDLGGIDMAAEIEIRQEDGHRLKTSVGRILLNEILPPALGFLNKVVDKAGLKRIVLDCAKILPAEEMARVLDDIKRLGFEFATKSGTTIGMSDIQVPAAKAGLISNAESRTTTIEGQYQRGLISEDERYDAVVRVWTDTGEKIKAAVSDSLDRRGGIYMMATSGAKGNISQITQMAGMRGLMTNPSGRIIDFPIKSSFREGLSVLEYFISTHGARKGLADTALRTSESGYLTRRLIDASHDIIVLEADCNTTLGVWITEPKEKGLLPSFVERIHGRYAAARVVHPTTGKTIVDRNEEIDEAKASEMVAAGINRVYARSPLSCQSRRGICQLCYGRDLSRGHIIDLYTAVGIIAAQSIGEPGTQLTLRTFHTGGVIGLDITSGLPRVEELFEARLPRNPAIISDINGTAEIVRSEAGDKIRVTGTEIFSTEYNLPAGLTLRVENGQWVDAGSVLASAGVGTAKEQLPVAGEPPLIAGVAGQLTIDGSRLMVAYEEKEQREYNVAAAARIRIQDGDQVKAGQQLTDGSINPQEMLSILGRDAVQQYLADEVQRVYRSQGVTINDKHIEIIIHQMLARVRVDSSGDTELVPGELIDRFQYEEKNAEVLAEGGEPATAHTVLLGVTRASLSTNSWLAAASFQETTKVLTEAAVRGAVDKLSGLKENVIIGRLIPARSRATMAAAATARKEEPTEILAEIEPLLPEADILPEPEPAA
jgi:DNA-directed RNA polymerase subunit beta'